MPYKQPSIEIFGIQIDEPVTSFTSLMISGVCLYAYIKLTKISSPTKVHFYLRYYFLVMAVATAFGGIVGHAFLFHFTFAWKLIGWIMSMLSIMLIERASIEYASLIISRKFAKWLKRINLFELALFITITIATLNFFFVEVHTTYGLLVVVASLQYYVYYKLKTKGSLLCLIAVGFASISAIIYMNQWGISKWFNHSDISHIFLCITAWFFYLGGKEIIKEYVVVKKLSSQDSENQAK